MQDGTPENQAWRIAMNDGLRDQNQYVAVPRRLAEIILDIWNIHFRLIKRNPRMVKASLNNRRFRAAYDFLLLRVTLHEVEEEVGEWWTRIQEVDAAEREEMITELGQSYKERRSNSQPQHADGEANGNSINYNPNSNGNQGAPGKGGQARHKQSARGGKKRRSKKQAHGQKRRTNQSNYGQRRADDDGVGNSRGGGKRRGLGRGKRGQNKSRAQSGGGYQGGNDGRYQNARPRDEYGTYQLGDGADEVKNKKVKVRRKRRILGPETDSNPHF